MTDADLVIAPEHQHVQYIRRHHPHGAARTATRKRLVRDLPAAGPTDEPLLPAGSPGSTSRRSSSNRTGRTWSTRAAARSTISSRVRTNRPR
ncbi:hypothetical protein [Embleya sp. NPDC005575]|uniref:hypothetical protein n=1 Tax=Embleya sp. NPDC005575 TaxID=3156892 RepID=UPI0033B62EEE